jgi:hypothetical protein
MELIDFTIDNPNCETLIERMRQNKSGVPLSVIRQWHADCLKTVPPYDMCARTRYFVLCDADGIKPGSFIYLYHLMKSFPA